MAFILFGKGIALASLAAVFLVRTSHACSAEWGQCGGMGFTGSTCCVSGSSCVYSNPWYSQCLPGSSNPTTTNPAQTTTQSGSTGNVGFNIGNLIDGSADSAATTLWSYIKTNFGHRVMSGQSETANTALNRDQEVNQIKSITGKTPLVRLMDFIFFTGAGAFDDGSIQRAIAWHQKGGIVAYQWHWKPGNESAFYTAQTSFDASLAVQSGTSQNQAILKDLATIAGKLLQLQNSGVPVIFRPLHEAGGTWFWWSAKGPAVLKQLWDIVRSEIANHGVHNVIWNFNFGTSGIDGSWYPGNTKCDLASVDRYSNPFQYDVYTSDFDSLRSLTGSTKPLALAENGPMPDINAMISSSTLWLYFGTWNGDYVMTQDFTTYSEMRVIYGSSTVIGIENR